MGRRKKEDQKRERLQRAAKKRKQLDARREARALQRKGRRLAGLSWPQRVGLHELWTGSLAHRGQAWCVLGAISMMLMVLVVLLAQIFAGRLGGVLLTYIFLPIFLPSFFGLLVFRYFEYVLEGEQFGRGKALDAPVSIPASSYQTKQIKSHRDDVLTIGPTIRDRMFGIVFLAVPALWYGLLTAIWTFGPTASDFEEGTSLLKISMPFLLPLPFVIVGIGLLAFARTLQFDRAQGRLRVANWWTTRVFLLEEVTSLQIIPGQSVSQGSSGGRGRFRRRTRSYPTVQLNLILDNPEYPRLNIAHDAARQEIRRMARTLAAFLNVPLDDAGGNSLHVD